MAAIFPPAAEGGVPPGPTVINGWTPVNTVIGEGPLYCSPTCTTILTDDQLNALTSEILAAVDRLGFPFNTNILTNLGDALLWLKNQIPPGGGDPGQALVKDPANIPAWGAPIDAGTYT
jgi:hypothetical protein